VQFLVEDGANQTAQKQEWYGRLAFGFWEWLWRA
jgi:hypothetical protein